MKLWSDSWTNGDRIPARYAAGRPDGHGRAAFGGNLNPHLAWSDVPEGARSMVLICHDFDVPLDASAVNRSDRELAPDCERTDFFHWVLVDLPPAPTVIGEGEFSRGFVPRGKPGPDLAGGPARQGLNDYTRWFASDPQLAGSYFGYDGPFPPWNDSLVHHYVFTLYAVALARLPLDGVFDGHAVRRVLAGRVLAEATFSGTFSLNPRLHGDG
jgi:Raf kinase inhibitor-like YbhB/YbcL family protein